MNERWELESHEGLPYRVCLPHGYDPGQSRYPVVVYLHGSGERGDDTQAHLKNGVETLESWPVIAIAPQCPREDTFGGSWYGGESLTQRKVVSLVRELGKRRSVDPQRISLIGFSMGAIATWDLIERHRELFCAAVPIAGDLNPESARALVDFPIWAFHGEVDPMVSNDAIRRVAKLMAQLGSGVFHYTELPGVGHDSWKGAFENAELKSWLLAQRR